MANKEQDNHMSEGMDATSSLRESLHVQPLQLVFYTRLPDGISSDLCVEKWIGHFIVMNLLNKSCKIYGYHGDNGGGYVLKHTETRTFNSFGMYSDFCRCSTFEFDGLHERKYKQTCKSIVDFLGIERLGMEEDSE